VLLFCSSVEQVWEELSMAPPAGGRQVKVQKSSLPLVKTERWWGGERDDDRPKVKTPTNEIMIRKQDAGWWNPDGETG
jgi:hypothetical protein